MMLIAHVVIYNTLLAAALFFLVSRNPRYMMQDYPKEITALVPQKTPEEKRASLRYGFPFLALLLAYPLALALHDTLVLNRSFIDTFSTVIILMMSFNLFDLLIIDWLIFCTITPRFMVIPGTEGHPGYRNYRFHARAFAKGTVFTIVASLVFSAASAAVGFLIH